MADQWQGKTRGGVVGHKIFVFVLSKLGLSFAYFFLHFVAFYYFLFSPSNRFIYDYFRKVHHYGKVKARLSVYRNYYVFGQTLLDKVAMLSGLVKRFTINRGGGENLDKVVALGKGGILISGHIGNWEVAGQLLERLNTKFNILMYENEHEQIKKYMDGVMQKKSFKVIAIREGDMAHLVELHNAFSGNELVAMHGDRYREGTKTVEAMFFGRPAKFPAGPFVMAARFGVPLVIVFAVKESNTRYHFVASEPIQVKRCRTEEETRKTVDHLLGIYITEFEKMVRAYPLQWFNYYDFWA